MAEPPAPGRPNWRQPKTPEAAPSAGKRGWQQQTAGPPPKSTAQGGRTMAIIGLLLLLGVVGYFFYDIFIKPTPITSVYLARLGAGYEDNLALPHNAYGMQGLHDVAAMASPWLEVDAVMPMTDVQAWTKAADQIRQKASHRALVAFVALHGSADDGEPPTFFLDSPAGRSTLPFAELVAKLTEGRDADAPMLLILEPALAGSYWPAGVLHNDFPAQLKALEGLLKEEHPNLLILCASGPGQVSWPCEEWRQTVFTHFLLEGLSGAASPEGTRHLSVGQLYDYVRDKVESWSSHNRGVMQTPILLGSRERAEKLDLAANADAPARETSLAVLPDELKSLWKETAQLRELSPRPMTYSPQLWRYYLDLGVRYEQLARAGYASDKLAQLRRRLHDTAADLRNQARCESASASLGWSLPMPRVLGLTPPPATATAATQELKQLLDAPNQKEPGKVLAAIENRVAKAGGWKLDSGTTKTLVRGQLQRALLRKFTKEISHKDLSDASRKNLGAVIDLLDAGQDRTAQTHFVRMLSEHLDRQQLPKDALLSQALRVSGLAEEAALAGAVPGHPYAEEVFAWVRPDVETADTLRRTGEDRLFLSVAQHQQAAQELGAAEAGYKMALDKAKKVRAALDLRDRALAELPDFAQWAARQRDPPAALGAKRNEEIARLTADLSSSLKALLAQLRGPRDFKQLDAKTTAAQEVYRKLGQLLTQECRRLKTQLDQHERWHQTEALLALPIVLDGSNAAAAVDNRSGLLQSSRGMAQNWNRGAEPLDAVRESTENGERAKQMVWAALEPYGLLEGRPIDRNRHVRAALDQLNGRLEQCISNSDPAGAGPQLAKGDLLCRGQLGAEAQANRRDVAPRRLRAVRMNELLLWQADRTGRDHWFAEPRNAFLGETYYQTAARAYLRAADQVKEALVGKDDLKLAKWLSAQSAAKRKQFAEPSRLALVGLPEAFWSGLNEQPLQWKLAKDGGSYQEPFGVAAAWVDELHGADLNGLRTEDGQRLTKGRLALEALAKAPSETVTATLVRRPGTPARAPVTAMFHALYRGCRLDQPVLVGSGDPDLIVRREAPTNKPRLAVQMEPNALCVVLDCSSSMLWEYKDGKTRFSYAIDALKKALTDLPEGTQLSVMRFMTPKDARATKYHWERPATPWNRVKDLEPLIGHLRELEANIDRHYSRSPIARALRVATDQGFATWPGPKVLVGLTDGDDNQSADDEGFPGLNEAQNVAWVHKYLKKHFGGSGIEVRVACFLDPNQKDAATGKTNDAEYQRARRQFSIVQDEDFFDPVGKFEPAADEKTLIEALHRAIRPKLSVQRQGGKTVELTASFEGEKVSRWRDVEAGEYKPRLQDRLLRQRLRVDPGESMLLTVARSGLHRLRRTLVTDDLTERRVGSGKTVVGLPLHHWDERAKILEQEITIEHDPSTDGDYLVQKRPRFVWIKTEPLGTFAPSLVCWSTLDRRTAPAYRLDASGWLAQDKKPEHAVPAQTRVWWTDSPLGDDVAYTLPVQLGQPFKKTIVEVGGARVSIDQITQAEVATYKDPTPRPCIMVRLSNVGDKKKQFFVEQTSALVTLEEHRYFSSAGRVTAIFWPTEELKSITLRILAVDAICERLTPARFDRLDEKIRERLLGEN